MNFPPLALTCLGWCRYFHDGTHTKCLGRETVTRLESVFVVDGMLQVCRDNTIQVRQNVLEVRHRVLVLNRPRVSGWIMLCVEPVLDPFFISTVVAIINEPNGCVECVRRKQMMQRGSTVSTGCVDRHPIGVKTKHTNHPVVHVVQDLPPPLVKYTVSFFTRFTPWKPISWKEFGPVLSA